jgi:hypothetical protein
MYIFTKTKLSQNENMTLLTLLMLFLGCADNTKSIYSPDTSNPSDQTNKTQVEAWVTSPENNELFKRQNIILNFANTVNQLKRLLLILPRLSRQLMVLGIA